MTPQVRVLWRRGAIVRVEADAADPEAYLRGVAEAIGLIGVDSAAWVAAVLSSRAGLIGLRLRDQGSFHEHDLVELVREMDGVPAGRGVVVGAYGNGGYEVEFCAEDGATIAVVTVGEGDIRLVED